MAYRGHQKVLTALLAACGIGGTGYGVQKYVKFNQIDSRPVTTSLHNVTSTIVVPSVTAVPESYSHTIETSPRDNQVFVEVNSVHSVPPNMAFRKAKLGGPLSYAPIIAGSVSILLSVIRYPDVLGLVILGTFLSLIMLYLRYHSPNIPYFRKRSTTPNVRSMDAESQTDEQDAELRLLKSDLEAAHEIISAVRQIIAPDERSPESELPNLIRYIEKSRKPRPDDRVEETPPVRMSIDGSEFDEEEVADHISLLEKSNLRLKQELERREDEILRLSEQSEIERTDYKRKKDHYKEIAHFIVGTHNASESTKHSTKDSLQKIIHDIMMEHNKELAKSQYDATSLRNELTTARKQQEDISQKLAHLQHETTQQDLAIQTEYQRFQKAENAQLLRTQERDDASAERERKLREQLEKERELSAIEVTNLARKIRTLELSIVEQAENLALNDQQKHSERFDRQVSKAMHEKDTLKSTSNDEIAALMSSISSLEKESASTKDEAELERHIQKEEMESSKAFQTEQARFHRLPSTAPPQPKKMLEGESAPEISEMVDKPGQPQSKDTTKNPGISSEQKNNFKKGDLTRKVEPTDANLRDTNVQHAVLESVNTEEQPRPENDSSPSTDKLKERSVNNGNTKDVVKGEQINPAWSDYRGPTVNPGIPMLKRAVSNTHSTSIPGLHPTSVHSETSHDQSLKEFSEPTDPLPIMLNFAPVQFTASMPTTAQSPFDATPSFDPSLNTQQRPSYFQSLSKGRRSTEAELNARRKAQPRRRNQTASGPHQTVSRSQSASSPLRVDQQALAAAMAPQSIDVDAADPDALELPDGANPLGKTSAAKAVSTGVAQGLNAPAARSNIFEGKTFDLNVPLSSDVDDHVAERKDEKVQEATQVGKDEEEDEVDWEDTL